MKYAGLFLLSLAMAPQGKAQWDTIPMLREITVRAFEQNKTQSQSATMVSIINQNPFSNKASLVTDLNTISGVRMEERSPGSYRVNIRGSSLRSPFGVRNVKVYWNDIPVTQPDGNTYFNQFAYNNFSAIEIFKGPVSSMYGAGTGGLIMMYNAGKQPRTDVEYINGSYGLHHILASSQLSGKGNTYISYDHHQSDGYRQQSAMRRDNASFTSTLHLHDQQELSASVLYTDLYYQTPGALTKKEYASNARSARPATGNFPSAIDAKAAIFQKTFLSGLTYSRQINAALKNKTTIYGSIAQVKNPAIRNFERRIEPSFGGRTVFDFEKKYSVHNSLQWNTGVEWQQGYYNIRVADNKAGTPDSVQTNDDIFTRNYNFFTQATVTIDDKWFYTAGIGFSKSKINFTRLSDYSVRKQYFAYKNELAPRFSVLHRLSINTSLLATVSKGFSPPTIAELLPSTGVITPLHAEHGWNYEFTVNQFLLNSKLKLEATGFYFVLQDALVQRRDSSGADYFTNAGSIQEKGFELSANYFYLPLHSKLVDHGIVKAAYTFNHFRYHNYIKDTSNFSGNVLPGIPAHTFTTTMEIYLQKGFYVNADYYTSSKIFMNDANTEAVNSYHIINLQAGIKKEYRKLEIRVHAGINNALNQRYSLGNDINAAGGRYYNAAPGMNYFIGVAFGYVNNH